MTNKKQTPTATGSGRQWKNDLCLVGGILLLVFLVGLWVFFGRARGELVEIRVDGVLVGEYSLAEDREVTVGEGAHINRLVIRDGEAYVAEATCPDGICAAHRPVSRDGESIVCLPHKVVFTVKRADKGVDVIV